MTRHIQLIRNIQFNVSSSTLFVMENNYPTLIDVSDEEMEQRRSQWTAPAYKATRGTLYKYIKNVKDASHGCVTDE